MEVKLVKKEGITLTYEVKIDVEGSLLDMEENIQTLVNSLGQQATGEALKTLDADGQAIAVNGSKHTSKGVKKKRIKPHTGV